MASVSFYLRPSSKKEVHSINVQFVWQRGAAGKFRKSLGIEIASNAWDKKKQRIKDIATASKYRHQVNQKLDEVEKWFEVYAKTDPVIHKSLVRQSFDDFMNPSSVASHFTLTEFIQHYKKHIAPNQVSPKTKKAVGSRALQGYETTLRWVKKYESAKKMKLQFTDLSLGFHKSFIDFLQSDQHQLAANTIGGYIKNLKLFARQAEKLGITINKAVLQSEFYMPKEETSAVYLSEDEIDLLWKHDFSDHPRFEKVRDWAIIGLWTGLRVSDWNRFGDIEDGMMTIKPQKTQFTSGKKVVIPVHPMLQQLLDTRGKPSDLSDVEFNRVIKDVCKEVGLTQVVFGSRMDPETNRKESGYFEKYKLIASHTCRRSFATNLYKSDFPSLSIMQITGHSTEKSFLSYIKVTPKEHAVKLRNHWLKKYGG